MINLNTLRNTTYIDYLCDALEEHAKVLEENKDEGKANLIYQIKHHLEEERKGNNQLNIFELNILDDFINHNCLINRKYIKELSIFVDVLKRDIGEREDNNKESILINKEN